MGLRYNIDGREHNTRLDSRIEGLGTGVARSDPVWRVVGWTQESLAPEPEFQPCPVRHLQFDVSGMSTLWSWIPGRLVRGSYPKKTPVGTNCCREGP